MLWLILFNYVYCLIKIGRKRGVQQNNSVVRARNNFNRSSAEGVRIKRKCESVNADGIVQLCVCVSVCVCVTEMTQTLRFTPRLDDCDKMT